MTTNKKSSKMNYIKYHNDGTVWAKGTMVDGVQEGYWEWFRKEGTKMRSGFFKKGKQDGEWTTYDRKGGVVKVTNFSGPRGHSGLEAHPLRKLD
jgi:antitoxin component YwqK of YwqJK toxin-antitoxin module